MAPPHASDPPPAGRDFLRTIVHRDMEEGRYDEVVTRFPPEPNGYLHIGHAKAIWVSFAIAEEFGGRCHLRFDDTNPETEEPEYARSMQEDIRWLGFQWDELYHAADYFEQLYEHAETLVRKGKAYVDSQSEEEIREGRGSLTEPGTESPYRSRSAEENLDLFRRMRAGEFPDGAHVLRGRIDMAHPNMIMRDPIFYRIRHAHHYRAGDDWCIYPLYDFAHCLEDAIEGVTHSFCSLEFENNREIYDWILDEVGYREPRPHQYEFSRLNLEYTVVSKRKLLPLIRGGHVAGWDDPRMSTLAGFRRRGVPPEAILRFVEMVGVTKTEIRVDLGKLEFAIRDHLNHVAPRVLAVLEPLKVVVTNLEDDHEEWLDAPYYPRDVDLEGSRKVPFSQELLVERSDFALKPPKGWRRLAPGWEVRLRHAYTLRCDEVVEDPDTGEVTELRCTVDLDTLGRNPDGRKVAGVIHWVSAKHARPAEVRLYDRLFRTPVPEDVPEGADLTANLNPESLRVLPHVRVEPSVAGDPTDTRYQFERTGYFWRDPVDASDERLVFNRIVSLRDTWSKRQEDAVGEGADDAEDLDTETAGEARGEKASVSARDRISDERAAAREADPELATRFRRYQDEMGLDLQDADVLTGSRKVSDLFQEALEAHAEASAVASWVVNDVMREMKALPPGEDLPFDGRALGTLVRLLDEDRISSAAAKTVFQAMVDDGADPEAVVREQGLERVADRGTLEPMVEAAMEAAPDKVKAYREGKTGLLGFFMGQIMRESGGAADPEVVREILTRRLDEG